MNDWYDDGLNFMCTQCGRCCTGNPGHVWVSPDEEQALASHLGLPLLKFRKRYLRLVGDRLSLLEKATGDCIFLTDDRSCAVHEVKPHQCLQFPFWLKNLLNRETWAETALECPGIGNGAHYSPEEIDTIASPESARDELWKLMSRKPD